MERDRHAPIDDIQVLRAAAILCVLIEHSWLNLVSPLDWFTSFLHHVPLWCGVDLFFVISGFVITRSLLRQVVAASHPGRVLARFWIRRAFRLWPAAWLWLALMVVGSTIFKDPPIFSTLAVNLRSALAGMLAYANIRFALHPMVPYGPSYPYWSLSLEEQFYLLLPPLLLMARRRVWWVALALILVQLPLAHPRLYFFLRNDGLLWGVLLASAPACQRGAKHAAAAIARVAFAGPIILLAAIGEMARLSPAFEASPPFLVGGMAIVAALPVWLAGADRDLFHCGPLQPAALWVGSRSYVLYLCHVPIYQFASMISHRIGIDQVFGANADARSIALAVPLLILAVEFTYRGVERPLRDAGARIAVRVRMPRDEFAPA